MLPPLKMYLDSTLNTYILKVFSKPLGIGDHNIDIAVFVVVIVTVSMVSTSGLIYTISIADVCLKSV